MSARLLDSAAVRVAGVVAVSFVLRPPLAGVGPILDDVSDAVGLSTTSASLLTALPVLCFGLGAFAGPALARRLGMDGAVAAVLLLLTVGLAFRVTGGAGPLFAGTVAAGAAIAVGNVLLPAVVKADFPERVGAMTGVYTATLSGAAALAALIAVPLLDWTGGWEGSLGVWAVVAAVAALAWLPQVAGRARRLRDETARPPAGPLLRSPIAWALTAFFGLQSLGFYAVLTWLPTLLQDAGYSDGAAGALLSLATVIGIPAALVMPAIAGRVADQRVFAVTVSALIVGGLVGLLVAPATVTVVWMVLLGLGIGAAFPLALLMVVLRSSTPVVTGQLSAMTQGVGYLLAALGPFVVGALNDATDSWRPPVLLLIATAALQGAAGWVAGRDRLAA